MALIALISSVSCACAQNLDRLISVHDTSIVHRIDSMVLAPLRTDSNVAIVRRSRLQIEWLDQTVNGQNVMHEKGTAGFFKMAGKSSGASVYAFHNTAARGSVMHVRNLNNGRSIYVKVLGPLPDSMPFAGCILGLSSGAKAALGVRETKAFCELRYAGY